MNPKDYNFYLAAPFFNAEQLELCMFIETLFKGPNGPNLFSPRMCDENSPGKKLNAEMARTIYNRNVRSLYHCHAVLAVVDWKFPEGKSVRVVEGQPSICSSWSPPLSLPDTGTVWEVGFANALRRRVALYTDMEPEQAKVNLMLTQGCEGVIYGRERLTQFLDTEKTGFVRWDLLEQWKGGHQ